MTIPHIALMGRAGSGKDTAGARLVSRASYTRVAFADPLKALALEMNPFIPTTYNVTVRLERLIADVGWDSAKDRYPEVRRTLQRVGHAIREQDQDYWLRIALEKVDVAEAWNLPVVVTDVRYRNEAAALKARGFRLVRVIRPGCDLIADRTNASHPSEHELDGLTADDVIVNSGTLNELYGHVDALAG